MTRSCRLDRQAEATPTYGEQCLAVVKKHFPRIRKADVGELLMAGTCFPFGTPEQVDANLVEAKAAGCKTWQACCAYADEQLVAHYQEGGDSYE